MKLPIILTCAAALTGCFYQSVDQSDLRKAAEFCKGSENVLTIRSGALGEEGSSAWTALSSSSGGPCVPNDFTQALDALLESNN